MKDYNNILLTILILMINISCSTVEKITVYGNPGEKIYSPSKQHIATVQQNGNVKIKLASDAYYGYMYTYNSTMNQWVPFALDITKKSHNGTKIAAATGFTMTALGVASFIGGGTSGIIDMINGSESEATAILVGAGIGAGGIGASFGVPASQRMGQLAYQYNFGYNSKQQINSDLNLTQYIPPIVDTPESTPSRKKATSGEASTATNSSSVKNRKNSATSTAKKKRKTASELIAGKYTGHGTLVTTGEDPETLDDMLIIITPKDDNTVIAEIMEDNEPFFESEELFTIKKNKDGSFTLTHTRIPTVKFTISKAGKIDYKHPKVNIDGTTYTLSITALKNSN